MKSARSSSAKESGSIIPFGKTRSRQVDQSRLFLTYEYEITMKKTQLSVRGVVEVVAALSLVASLAIVIMELSANEKAIRSATASDVALSLSSWYTNIGIERVGGAVFRKGMIDPDSLAEEETLTAFYVSSDIHGFRCWPTGVTHDEHINIPYLTAIPGIADLDFSHSQPF